MEFQEIKMAYIKAREEQKRIIIDELKKEGFIILNMDGNEATKPYKTGSGYSRYNGGKDFEPYDLSNWKWISARNEKLSLDFEISLQAFDIDLKT